MGKQDKQKIRRYRIGKKNPLLELRYRELKSTPFNSFTIGILQNGIKTKFW